MFRIECFVDDSKLAKALWALRAIGGVYNVDAQPVVNAQKANGEVRSKRPSGSLLQALPAYLAKHKLKVVEPHHLKKFVESEGMLPKSYSNVLRDACNTGLLQRIGDSYRYRVKKAGIMKKTTKRKS